MTTTRKSLLENVFSLSSLQIANYLAPLAVLPYLARVLGPANYGEVFFSQTFIQFIIIFTDYGFMHNGAREVAVCRDDLAALRRFVTESLVVRTLLLAIAAIALVLLCTYVPPFNLYPSLHYFTFGMAVSDVITMPFFFLGMERMRIIALTGIIARGFTIAGVFFLITDPSDFVYVTLIYSVSYLGSGIVVFYLMMRTVGWKLSPLSMSDLVERFKMNAGVFLTSMSINVSNAGNMLILRLYASPETVGLYGVVDKVVMAAVSMSNPVFHTLLPYISRLARESADAALRRIRQTVWLSAISGTLFFLGGFFGSGLIVKFVFGAKYAASEPIMQWLSALPAGMWMTMALGNLYFIAFGKYKIWSRLFIGISAAGVTLALVFVGVFQMESTGIVLALLIRVYAGLALTVFLFHKASSDNSAILKAQEQPETIEL